MAAGSDRFCLFGAGDRLADFQDLHRHPLLGLGEVIPAKGFFSILGLDLVAKRFGIMPVYEHKKITDRGAFPTLKNQRVLNRARQFTDIEYFFLRNIGWNHAPNLMTGRPMRIDPSQSFAGLPPGLGDGELVDLLAVEGNLPEGERGWGQIDEREGMLADMFLGK